MLKKSVIVLSIAAVAAMAAPKNGYEVSGAAGWQFDPTGDKLKNGLVYGARIGKRLFDNKIVEFAYDRVDDLDYDHADPTTNKHPSTNLNRYAINGILEHPDYDTIVPYLLLGAGYEDWTKERDGVDSGGMVNWGLGVRYALSKWFHLKAEAKQHINFNGFSTITTMLLATVPFGYPAPAPVVAPKPAPVVVEEIDSDGDGVLDKYDECPGTPKGFKVDKVGCPLSYDFRVNFDFNKATIKPEFEPEVENFSKFLEKNPYNVMLKGYTDSTGPAAYNQKLSDRRAKSIESKLESLGIPADRIEAKGYGESDPVASNKTKDGRYQNRRVTAELETPEQ